MTLRNHLVIMTKAPRLGRVKRRLGADIGAFAALIFYRRTLAQLLRRVAPDPRWQTWLYVTPDDAVHRDCRWPRHIRRRAQGRGDLGVRMRLPQHELPPGAVVIIGCDIPDLTRDHVAQAFALLGRNDAVFGPAADGGYWLVGARRRPHLPVLFHHVRWSTSHALADTLANFDARHRIAFIETLEDIDDGASYARLQARRREAQLACFRCS